MTVEQFNNSIERVQEKYPHLVMGKNFVSTFVTDILLYQTFQMDAFDNIKPDLQFFRNNGLVLAQGACFSLESMEETQFNNSPWPKIHEIHFVTGDDVPKNATADTIVINREKNTLYAKICGNITKGEKKGNTWFFYGDKETICFLGYMYKTGKLKL